MFDIAIGDSGKCFAPPGIIVECIPIPPKFGLFVCPAVLGGIL